MPEVQLVTPAYEAPQDVKIEHNSLARLGYKKGRITAKDGHITYRQKAYGDVAYEIDVRWKQPDAQTLEGTFCLTTEGTPYSEATPASKQMKSYAKDFATALHEHTGWWKNYWEQCSLSLPAAGAAMVSGDVQIRRCLAQGCTPYLPAGRMDGRQRADTTLER